MSDQEFKPSEALLGLNQTASELIDAIRVTRAPEETIDAVRLKLNQALALLDGHARPGPYAQAELNSSAFWNASRRDPQSLMPYSPVIGDYNPVSARFRFFEVGDQLEGHGDIPVRFVGSPGNSHGGYVAAILDEAMGLLNFMHGAGAFTGTLSVRYHRPTPILTPLHVHAEITHREGRKLHTRGELRCNGELTASSEGVFIVPQGDFPGTSGNHQAVSGSS